MDTVSVCSENHMKHLTRQCQQNADTLMLKRKVHVFRWASDGYKKFKMRVKSQATAVPQRWLSAVIAVANAEIGNSSDSTS